MNNGMIFLLSFGIFAVGFYIGVLFCIVYDIPSNWKKQEKKDELKRRWTDDGES